MPQILRHELHAPLYYSPIDDHHLHKSEAAVSFLFDGDVVLAGIDRHTTFWRDTSGFEWLITSYGASFPLGCRVLVPHSRANHRRDYGRFLLARQCTRFLRGVKDLIFCVERFIH